MTSIASISKAASGSLAAVGGEGVINSGGGGPAGLQDNTSHNPSAKNSFTGQNFQLSLPNTGSFLRLVSSARSHLLQLLSRSKYNEAPVDLLRERWNGGVVTGHRTARSKEPFGDLLPGKTKKWKEFYGLNFDWALAECVGAGLVEVFETGSVGRGVRAI
jgi:SulP family sulfate permease